MTPVTHTGNKFVKMEEPSQGLNMSIHPLLAGCGIDHNPSSLIRSDGTRVNLKSFAIMMMYIQFVLIC